MSAKADFDRLIGSLYEAPLSGSWQEFLENLRQQARAEVATLVLTAPGSDHPGMLATAGGVPGVIQLYRDNFYALDPFVDLPGGEVLALVDYLGGQQAYLSSDLYKVCMQPAGLFDCLGADVLMPGEFEARLRVARAPQDRAFTAKERALVSRLLPHLQRAIRIHGRLNAAETERILFADTVESLSLASFILRSDLRLLRSNRLAQQLLDGGDMLRSEGGKLRLADSIADAEFQQLLIAAVSAPQPLVRVMNLKRPKGPDLGLVIRALDASPRTDSVANAALAVFVSDPALLMETPVEAIRRLFGLTPAESQLSLLLTQGFSLDECATELGVSRNTARTHLRAIFSKTGVTRQTLLVRLLLRSVAPLAAEPSARGN